MTGAIGDPSREIEQLHGCLSGWLNGTSPNAEDVFRGGIESRFHADFTNIQPAGLSLSRAQLLHQLRLGWGQSPDFRILIRNVRLHTASAATGLCVVTYEEYQRGARNSARAENARISTALLELAATGAYRWLHIHETWLPEDHHCAAAFDF